MNILITSAGRRGYIVEYFKKALHGHGKVYVGNSTSLSSAFFYGDERIVTPLIYSDDYIPFLLDFCREKNIQMILSLFDIDLQILARNKAVFRENGVSVIVSDEDVINICNDKWKTYCFANNNNIFTPKTYLKLDDAEIAIGHGGVGFPLMVKPRWGMGSLAIYQVENAVELKVLYNKCISDIQKTYLKYESAVDLENCVIIQEKLQGEEYGIDIIHDLQGEFCNNIVRKKYAMRAGETDCAMVVRNTELDAFAHKLGTALGHIANLDVDVFVSNNKVYLLEMNARFGGGYPFSHLSGVDLPRAIVKWISGKRLEDELNVKTYGRLIQKDIQFVDLTDYQV